MGIKRLAMTDIGYDKVINIGLTHKALRKSPKALNMFGGIKNLFGKIVTMDEEWISKSENWPYLWTKK